MNIHLSLSAKKGTLEKVSLMLSAGPFSFAWTGEEIDQLSCWLIHYLKGESPPLALPLEHLTPFSRRVLEETQKIPFGQTVCYQTIAERIGNRKAARAVGRALNGNPYPIFIPCHRVTAKKIGIGGFAYPLKIKEILLHHEKKHKKSKTPITS